MIYEEALNLTENPKFCNPVKSLNLSYDLQLLKEGVIPALKQRIKELERALQRDTTTMFKKDSQFLIEI